jgi:CRISPR-associated protein Csx14
MAKASIPVDLFNPGQVFACMGFLEATEVLLGNAEGAFDWSDEADVRFQLIGNGQTHPFEYVLDTLAGAKLKQFCPIGYDVNEDKTDIDDADGQDATAEGKAIEESTTFPTKNGDKTTLPIRIGLEGHSAIELSHWVDGSDRDPFKLYSGNRSAFRIASAMLNGTRKKPSKKQKKQGVPGDLQTKGVIQLWLENRPALIEDPFGVLTPMGGSFNFDPRGGWAAIDMGYSPNEQKSKHAVEASPLVELLTALGLQNSRPAEYGLRGVRYAAWGTTLPTALARVALSGALPAIPMRSFRFTLALSGKNKVVTFSQEELS